MPTEIPKAITTDADFIKKSESFGAFYNYYFYSREFNYQHPFMLSINTIHNFDRAGAKQGCDQKLAHKPQHTAHHGVAADSGC